ncbi:unnamed protein product [Ilex paraguariensis]|uniref:Uncharacterized protein n=1 Tax=Ilex paraguariensis TaxID=185542 RepID=A0ABC8UH33_9AQUA
MSKMMRLDRKPPLARSPIRLRSRRAPHSSANILQTPPGRGSLMKPQLPKRDQDIEEMELRPEYHTISCELRALAKMVQDEFGNDDMGNFSFELASNFNAQRSPLFERGRFYDEYSARRNERLKRKKGQAGDEKKPAYDLGVRVESAKRRESKKFESVRRTVSSTPMAMTERRETPRYMLRSSFKKENKKPSPSLNFERSVGGGERIGTVRKVRKN